jgi:hypothetical protein
MSVFVGGYVENADGTVGYFWTADHRQAAKLGREAAFSAAVKVEAAQAAWHATKDEDYRAAYPLRSIVIRPTTGGESVGRPGAQ